MASVSATQCVPLTSSETTFHQSSWSSRQPGYEEVGIVSAAAVDAVGSDTSTDAAYLDILSNNIQPSTLLSQPHDAVHACTAIVYDCSENTSGVYNVIDDCSPSNYNRHGDRNRNNSTVNGSRGHFTHQEIENYDELPIVNNGNGATSTERFTFTMTTSDGFACENHLSTAIIKR